jgi:hypothetical protein
MNKIIRINLDDMDIELEPGVNHTTLNKEIKHLGFFVTPDPAPGASVGGMVATNCSGPNACRLCDSSAALACVCVCVWCAGFGLVEGVRIAKSVIIRQLDDLSSRSHLDL